MLNKLLLSLFIFFALFVGYWIFFGLKDRYNDADINLDMPVYPSAAPRPSPEVLPEMHTDDEMDAYEPENLDPSESIPAQAVLPDEGPASVPDTDNWPEGIPRPGETGTLLSPSLRDLGDEWVRNPAARTNFSMPLPNGQEVEIEVQEFIAIGEDGGEFIGTIRGYPDSRVSLSYRGTAEAGLINLPSQGRSIQVLPGADGQFFFHESPYSPQEGQQTPAFDQPIPPPPDFIPPPPPADLFIPDLPDAESASPSN